MIKIKFDRDIDSIVSEMLFIAGELQDKIYQSDITSQYREVTTEYLNVVRAVSAWKVSLIRDFKK